MDTATAEDGGLVAFADYLKRAPRPADRPTFWSTTELDRALETLPHGERGTVALAKAPQGALGEVAPGLSLVLQEVKEGEKTSPHRHSFWHLYIVRKGAAAAAIEGSDSAKPIVAGDILFVPPWHAHAFDNRAGTVPLVLLALQNLPQLAALGCLMREDENSNRHLVHALDQG